jgi:hypothetical protein
MSPLVMSPLGRNPTRRSGTGSKATDDAEEEMTMKQAIVILAAGLVFAGMWSVLAIPGLAQSPAVQQQPPRVYRYAYVTPVNRQRVLGAEICYAEPTGCRMEVVTVTAVEMPASFAFGVIDSAETASRAMAKAVRQLGQQRWEMIGSGPAYGHAREATAVHFRRAE